MESIERTDAIKPLRYLGALLAVLGLQACHTTTHYPNSQPVEVVLRFSHGDNQPMSHDLGVANARQNTRYKTCHRLLGSWRCDESLNLLYGPEQGTLDENGAIKVKLRSSGPIGDYPTTRCINGKGYTFMTGKWQQGPFEAGQTIFIRYTISQNKMNCSYSEVTPPWWPND